MCIGAESRAEGWRSWYYRGLRHGAADDMLGKDNNWCKSRVGRRRLDSTGPEGMGRLLALCRIQKGKTVRVMNQLRVRARLRALVR